MSGTTNRDVQLAIRVQDLASAPFKQVADTVALLNTKLAEQVEAAKNATISSKELTSTQTQLKQAQDALLNQSALVDRFELLSVQLDAQKVKLTQATEAQAGYVAKLNEAGEPTARAVADQKSLAAAVTAAQKAVDSTQATLTRLEAQLTAAGIDTRDLASAQTALVVAARQVGQGLTTANAALLTYAENARKARDAAKDLAAAQKATGGGAQALTPNVINPPAPPVTPNAAPGFIRPTLPQSQQSKSTANQTGLFGLQGYELTNLSYQFNDVITGLLSGQNKFQIAAQQGGQIVQIFQKNLFDLLPLLARLSPLIVAAGVAFEAFNRGLDVSAAARQFTGDLTSTTNGVLYQTDTLVKAQKTLQDYGVSWTDAGKIIASAVSTGISSDRITQFGKTAQDIAERTGGDVKQIYDNLQSVFTGSFDGIVKLNEQLGFWDANQVAVNRDLAQAGQLSKAQANGIDALTQKQAAAAAQTRGPFTQAWRDIQTLWRELLDDLATIEKYDPTIVAITTLFQSFATAIHLAADAVRALNGNLDETKSKRDVLPTVATPGTPVTPQTLAGRQQTLDTSSAISAGVYKQVPTDMIAVIADAASKANLDQGVLAQIYRNEAVRNPDGTFQQGAPVSGGAGGLQRAQGAFQVEPTTFKPLIDELTALVGRQVTPADINDNAINALAAALILKQNIASRAGDLGAAAGDYFAGGARNVNAPGPKTTDYITKFNAGYVPGVVPTAAGTPATSTTPAAGAGSGSPVQAQTEAQKAADAEALKNQQERLQVEQNIRDVETQDLRVKLAGNEAVAANKGLSDSALTQIRATAEQNERNTIAAENYQHATKEAEEDVKSGANATADRVAYLIGQQTAYANGVRNQTELDAAGDTARETARAKRIQDEKTILDLADQQKRIQTFGPLADQVTSAGQLAYNKAVADGISTVQTLRDIRNKAEDEEFAKLQRNQQLIKQGDSLQTQLASLARGDLKSPAADLQNQLLAVQQGYQALFRRIDEFKAAGGTSVQTTAATATAPATTVPIDDFKASVVAAEARTEALTRVTNAEQSLAAAVQARTTLVKAADDLVAAGTIGYTDGETAKKKAYEDTNAEITKQTQLLADQATQAQATGALSGARLDIYLAKIKQVTAESQYLDPLQLKLRQDIPQTFGDATIKGIEGVGDALGTLAAGTATTSQAFRAMGVAVINVFLDIAKKIAETIIQQELMNEVKDETASGTGAIGTVLKLIGLAGGAASGGGAATSTLGTFYHSGGFPGITNNVKRPISVDWFANAPRYHDGGLPGLAPDERAIIAKVGEEVLSPNDPRNALNANRGSPANGPSGKPFVLNNNLYLDPTEISKTMRSDHGQAATISTIRSNAAGIRQILNIPSKG